MSDDYIDTRLLINSGEDEDGDPKPAPKRKS